MSKQASGDARRTQWTARWSVRRLDHLSSCLSLCLSVSVCDHMMLAVDWCADQLDCIPGKPAPFCFVVYLNQLKTDPNKIGHSCSREVAD